MDFVSGLRRRQGNKDDGQRPEVVAFTVVGAVVLIAALVGILTRQAGIMAFWPASAVLIGLFVRAPKLAGPGGWLGAFLGFAIADLVMTGDSLDKMLALAFANFCEVAAGYLALRSIAEEHQRLRQPFSILFVFLACIAGAVVFRHVPGRGGADLVRLGAGQLYGDPARGLGRPGDAAHLGRLGLHPR